MGSAQCSHWTTTAPLLVSAAVALLFVASPLLDAQNSFPTNVARAIGGAVKSSGTAIPGVTITAANALSGQKTSTSTDVNGKYNLEVSANGRYVVRAQMAAFASSTQEVVIHDSAPTAKADFDLTLLSRVQELDKKRGQQATSGPATQGFRTLSLLQGDSTFAGANGVTGGMESVNSDLFAPGMSNTSGTESVSVSANAATSFANMSSEEMRQRFEEFRQQNDAPSGSAGGPGGGLLGGPGGGGPGGGPGSGFGGPGGGPPPFVLFGGNRGRFNLNRPHGSLFYTVGSDALNAAPYSLTGQSVAKPGYLQNQFGVNLGGPLRIPRVYANNKMFFFFN